MDNKRYYLFLHQDGYVSGLQDAFNLPFSDESYFISGFLVNKQLSDDEVHRNINYQNKGVQLAGVRSRYYTGDIVLEDHEPKTDEEFSLDERGSFIITLAGPGYNNTNNHSKFEGDWEKVAIKDVLKIKDDFTWERRKEIDPGFFLTWKGNYSYSGDLVVFSLSGQGYSGESFSGNNDNYIPHYGIMYGPVDNTSIISGDISGNILEDKIIFNTFLDDSFADSTNFYKNINTSGVISDITDGITNTNPGGRGQLSKYFIYNTSYQSDISYDVGSWENNTNTKLRITGFPELEAVSGYETDEESVSGNFFGCIGGNAIQNSFDFYQKNTSENGYLKLIYSSPVEHGLNLFRTLEITTSGILVLPDEPIPETVSGDIVINKMLAQYETDVYYRILERDQELDIINSTLNEKPLCEYNIKYEKPKFDYNKKSNYTIGERLARELYSNNEIYITEFDNHRRKISFLTPYKSNISGITDNNKLRNIKLHLQTRKRKFYFAIARDQFIDTVTINDTLFYPDDQDKDGIYRRIKKRDLNGDIILDEKDNPVLETGKDYAFYAGDNCKIEIRFTEEARSLMKDLVDCYKDNYLSGYLEPHSISKSNNYVQTIDLFSMPARDVLLFLKTELVYILNIYISKESKYLNIVNHETETIFKDDRNIPIIIKHLKNDEITIEVYFNNPFSEINKEDLKNQLYDVDDILFSEREYTPYEGYDIEEPQIIKFLMPARDVTLYLKEKDYRNKVKILIERNTKYIEKIELEGDTGGPYYFDDPNNPADNDNPLKIETSFNTGRWLEIPYNTNEKVKIIVYFKDINGSYYNYIDEDFLKAQLASIQFEDREYINPDERSLGFNKPDQYFDFDMPENDIEIIIKENNSQLKLTIKPEQYQYDNPPSSRKIMGIVHNNILENWDINDGKREIEVFENQEITIFVQFSDIYMHLDKDHLISQYPKIFINEAGDSSISNSSPYNNPHTEYYQKVTITISNDNLTLILKWTERLYKLDIAYSSHAVEYLKIFDTGKVNNMGNSGNKIDIRRSTFPHYTYNKVCSVEGYNINGNSGNPDENQVQVIMGFKNNAFVMFDYNFDGIFPDIDSRYGFLKFSFNMPKRNLLFFIGIRYADNAWVLIEEQYCQGSVFLDAGLYQIWVGGADGGKGGGGTGSSDAMEGSLGYIGGRMHAVFTLSESGIMEYKIGSKGLPGMPLNAGTDASGDRTGGGGGGGATMIKFSVRVAEGYELIFCEGGDGGMGGHGSDSGVAQNSGGPGGDGGTHNSLSKHGHNGSIRNRKADGIEDGHPGGAPGFSFKLNDNNPINTYHYVYYGRNTALATTTNDGYIQLQYLHPI